MKIKKVIESELDNFTIQIKFYVSTDGNVEDNVSCSYTCPHCAGYGCMNNHGNGCTGGQISENIDGANLDIPQNIAEQIRKRLVEIAYSIK